MREAGYKRPTTPCALFWAVVKVAACVNWRADMKEKNRDLRTKAEKERERKGEQTVIDGDGKSCQRSRDEI